MESGSGEIYEINFQIKLVNYESVPTSHVQRGRDKTMDKGDSRTKQDHFESRPWSVVINFKINFINYVSVPTFPPGEGQNNG